MRQTKDKKRVISWVLILSIITANLNVPLMAAEQTQTYIADSGNDILQTSNITNEENGGLENQVLDKLVSDNQTSENQIPDGQVLDDQVSDNQISDNQISENEISENEVPGTMISKNAVSGNEIGIFDLTKAKQSLSEILNQKDIMALVYLTDSFDVRKDPSLGSDSVKKVKSGQLVFIQDVAIGLDDEAIWYYVKIAETDTYGYLPRYYLACSDELLLEWEKEYLGGLSTYENAVGGDTSAEIEAFPGSYRNKLYQLKALHPNWTFVPYQPGIDWNTAIDKQYGNYSWIYYNAPSEYKEGSADTHWNYASKAGIAYYMDPRNFLNDSNLFQFEHLTYNESYQTESGVKSLLSGTFMSGEIPKDDGDSTTRTYSNVFYSLGKSETLRVSPYHLAARVFLEQGKGTSDLISGVYPGYEHLYNYFNIGASGSGAAVIISGLTKARSLNWTTRYASLAGGAKFIGSGYIKIGQDTIYLEKFDMPSLKDGSSLHQYMQNIQAPYSEGNKIRKAYYDVGKLNSVFLFKIPVYENMPNAVSLSTTSKTMNKGTTYQLTGSMNGSKVAASNFTWSSSNSTIASVNSSGLVTAIAVGANGA
ncbi:MAG: Ig-like domain-containing protein, partial [Lachnospiraceae bacterium]|nr:Ig-like domain-containing protein [Lachnospiraceae bacterium]